MRATKTKLITLALAIVLMLGLAVQGLGEGTEEPGAQAEPVVVISADLVTDEQATEETPAPTEEPVANEPEVAEETPEPVEATTEPSEPETVEETEEPVVETPEATTEPVVDEQPGGVKAPSAGDTQEEEAPKVTEYEIIYVFYDHQGEREVRDLVPENGRIEKPSFTPEIEGYAFQFWYNPEQEFEDDIIVEFTFGEAPTEDLRLNALYLKNAVSESEEAEGEPGEPEYLTVPEKTPEEQAIADREIIDMCDFITIIEDPQDEEAEDVVVVDDEESEGVVLVDDEEDEETVIEEIGETEVPLAGPSTEDCRIILGSNHGGCVVEGESLTVWAELIGYEPFEVSLQWLYNDGTGWVEMEGATEASYTFVATRENVNYDWRLAVTILGETMQADAL